MQNNYFTVFVRHYLAFKTSRLKVTKPDINLNLKSCLFFYNLSFVSAKEYPILSYIQIHILVL